MKKYQILIKIKYYKNVTGMEKQRFIIIHHNIIFIFIDYFNTQNSFASSIKNYYIYIFLSEFKLNNI